MKKILLLLVASSITLISCISNEQEVLTQWNSASKLTIINQSAKPFHFGGILNTPKEGTGMVFGLEYLIAPNQSIEVGISHHKFLIIKSRDYQLVEVCSNNEPIGIDGNETPIEVDEHNEEIKVLVESRCLE